MIPVAGGVSDGKPVACYYSMTIVKDVEGTSPINSLPLQLFFAWIDDCPF
jgi:hypothetical protein